MPNNKLILRSVNSPWVTPFNDITKNTVLGWSDVDNNFIYLKGELIHSGYTNNNTLFLQKINGNTISVNLNITPSGTDVYVTGGTYSNGTLELLNNTGGTFNVNGFYTGSTDNYTTGATLNDTILSFDRTDALSAYTVDLSSLTSYGNQWFIPSGTTVEVKENYQSFIYGDLHIEGLLLLNDNAQLVVLNGDIILSGGSISGNGTTLLVNLPEFDTKVTGATFDTISGVATFTNNSGGSFILSGLASNDVFLTGGTYNPTTGTATFTNNSGGTFNVNGFLTGYTNYYTTGATLNDTILSFDRTDSLSAYTVDLSSLTSYGNQWFIPSGTTVEVKENYQSFIYGDLYIEGLLLLNDNSQLVILNGDIILSGGSISGNGTTLLVDLPEFDTYITGGTYLNGDLILTDNFGADITVNGFYTGSTDTYVTGGTYFSGGTIVFNYNTGGDFEVSGLTIDLDSEIAGLAEADEQTITLNLDTNKIELKETIAEATGGTRTFQGDFAISGGTLNLDTIGSGSPVINLGLDSSGFVVTGTTSTPFTGNTSGDCISDLYVSNVHSCSPLHINPNDEGNIYFGSASGVTVDLTNHKLVVENLQITSGATDGYILTSDANGNIELTAPTDGFTYQIGQYVEEEGGVIFHRYKDNGTEYYLVVDIIDLGTPVWSNIDNVLIGTSAQSIWDGLSNSNAVISQLGFTTGASKLCLDSTNNSQTDWYLPSFSELTTLFQNLFNVEKTLSGNSSYGIITGAVLISNKMYWSSTELNDTRAWVIVDGVMTTVPKYGNRDCRAVRKFSI